MEICTAVEQFRLLLASVPVTVCWNRVETDGDSGWKIEIRGRRANGEEVGGYIFLSDYQLTKLDQGNMLEVLSRIVVDAWNDLERPGEKSQ